jgi:hypothetical protein
MSTNQKQTMSQPCSLKSGGTMRGVAIVAVAMLLFACTQTRHAPEQGMERADVTFHILGLMKTPSGAT